MSRSQKVVVFVLILTTELQRIVPSWTEGRMADSLVPIIENTSDDLQDSSGVGDDTLKIEYWLFTKTNPKKRIITSFKEIDPIKPIKILIHGWITSAYEEGISIIKKAYLVRYDYNIILINYGTYASMMYSTTNRYVPGIGADVARFICKLNATLDIQLESIHVIGHSLGGQIIGFVGKSAQKMCGKIGRITGLDPAGPLYQHVSSKFRLHKTDAILVDVIHTNQGYFGYSGSCGSVDFFPNMGHFQPGCEEFNSSFLQNFCSHHKSCTFFAESIYRNGFYATSCNNHGTLICIQDALNASHVYMGENLKLKATDAATYILWTNPLVPQGKGPVAPIN